MVGRKSGLFGSCCGRDGRVITPFVTSGNESPGAKHHVQSIVSPTCDKSEPSMCSSGTNNPKESSEITVGEQRRFSEEKNPVGELQGDGTMDDLESPHYVKRTAHIFQSQSITTHNGNGLSHTQINSPSYINVARSVSGYTCISYNNVHPQNGKLQEIRTDRWRHPVRSSPSTLDAQRSRSLSKASLQRPCVPKSAPPLASPALVGRTMGVHDFSNSRSMILERIQRLYAKTEGESQPVFWKKKTPPPRSPSPVSAQRLISIQLEGEEASSRHNGEDVVDIRDTDKIEGEFKDTLSEEDSSGKLSLQPSNVRTSMSPVHVNEIDPKEKDGTYFLQEMDQEKSKIEQLIENCEAQLIPANEIEEEAGQIRAAIGKARLLINKKFKQFEGLCHQNLDQKRHPTTDGPLTKNEDLEGFWDMVLIQVDQIHSIFKELDPNHYKAEDSDSVQKYPMKKTVWQKNGGKAKPVKTTTRTTTAAADENRRALLAEKRKAMKALAMNQSNIQGDPENIEILSAPPNYQ